MKVQAFSCWLSSFPCSAHCVERRPCCRTEGLGSTKLDPPHTLEERRDHHDGPSVSVADHGSPHENEQTEEAEELASSDHDRHPLLKVALLLEQRFSHRAAPDLELEASFLGLHRSTLVQQLPVVAEKSLLNQALLQESIASYAKRLEIAKDVKLVAYYEHILYDETRLHMRVQRREGSSTETQTEIAKAPLFVLEPSWAMLIRKLAPSQQAQARTLQRIGSLHEAELDSELSMVVREAAEQYTYIMGFHSTALRAGERVSGEGVWPVLASLPAPPQPASQFKVAIRVVEVDEAGGNRRAEELIKRSRPPCWASGLVVCICHKIHSCAERVWSLRPLSATVCGLIHMGLFMGAAGMLTSLRRALIAELASRPLLFNGHSSAERPSAGEVAAFQQQALRLFTPWAADAPRQRALAEVVATEILNGSWAGVQDRKS